MQPAATGSMESPPRLSGHILPSAPHTHVNTIWIIKVKKEKSVISPQKLFS